MATSDMPTDYQSLASYLKMRPCLWSLVNGHSGRLVTCESIINQMIRLNMGEKDKTYTFCIGPSAAIQYTSNRFIRILDKFCCEYYYVEPHQLSAYRWTQIFSEVDNFHLQASL
jgi:hypothetical protein